MSLALLGAVLARSTRFIVTGQPVLANLVRLRLSQATISPDPIDFGIRLRRGRMPWPARRLNASCARFGRANGAVIGVSARSASRLAVLTRPSAICRDLAPMG